MIEPGRSGHRNQAVARDAARQVSTKKDGFRLTWILTDPKSVSQPPAEPPKPPLRTPPGTASTEPSRATSLTIAALSADPRSWRTFAFAPIPRSGQVT